VAPAEGSESDRDARRSVEQGQRPRRWRRGVAGRTLRGITFAIRIDGQMASTLATMAARQELADETEVLKRAIGLLRYLESISAQYDIVLRPRRPGEPSFRLSFTESTNWAAEPMRTRTEGPR
jgi:hypothetical protein